MTGILSSVMQPDHLTLVTMVIWAALATVTWKFTSGHPQCLDFLPPFELEDDRDVFCDNYKTFGCCTRQKNNALRKHHADITRILSRDGLWNCDGYIKELLCQECSPYAAHIYDAETTLVKRPLAGMCGGYCSEFYRQCRDAVQYITDDRAVLSSLTNKDVFCGSNALSDKDYCYPDILTNSNLNRNLSRSTVTEEGCLCLELFAKDLRNPLIFRSPDDQSGLVYVGTQIGVIYVYSADGTRRNDAFMNLTDVVLTSVYAGDERGLLGLAFHPDFKYNRKFYLFFSVRSNSGNRQQIRISEFKTAVDDAFKADRFSERKILEVNQPYGNHNGGELLFGVDGYLYAFLGDGGAGGDPHNHGQNRSTLLGSVLRLDIDSPDSNVPYGIPVDNPFINDPASRPEIFAYGIRNIWRCDVDEGHPITGYGRGRILCGDVGQSAFEEIDEINAGKNYGWNSREGFQCYKQDKCGKIGAEELPLFAYPHSVGNSVTGGHIYRGCLNPNLQGHYIYGDYGRGRLFRLKETADHSRQWENKEIQLCANDVCFNGLTNQYERNILSFGEDFNGEIYMLTTSWPSSTSPSGKIYKIVDPRRRGDETLCRSSGWDTSTQSTPSTISSTTEDPVSTSTTLSTTSAPAGCADIAFILDASGSVGFIQFTEDLLKFVVSQVDALSLGLDSFQVGVITFGNKAKINIPLDRSHNHQELRSLILGIHYKDENTNTSGALREMRTRLFTPEFGSRNGYKKIGVLLTDGKSTYDKVKTIPEALELHRDNIEMYVISFGSRHGLDQQELQVIASSPIAKHLLHQNRLNPDTADILPWKASTSRYMCAHTLSTDVPSVPSTRTHASTTTTVRTSSQPVEPTTASSSQTQFPSTLTKMMTSQVTKGLHTTTEDPLQTTTESSMQELWSCDFDSVPPSDPWCGILQSVKDKFNWRLTNRETPSQPTGPVTAQNGHYYIYIETSNPRRVNDTALIYLPSLTSEGDLCLTFYVHMYGFHIREIQVLVEKSSGKTAVAWKRQKEQGNYWFQVLVDLAQIELTDKIGFLGIRGEEYSGDIALDNIHLYQGRCQNLNP